MAKRKRIQNIEKMIKEGRGQGRGKEYKPWLTIQDVPSKGRVSRVRGNKTGRNHEFLSDLERNCFYIFDYATDIVDIREQYPLLVLEETQSIAKSLGIKHPQNPKTGEDNVLTTDFLITKEVDGKEIHIARTIKEKSQLSNKRIIEKFEIERAYWESRGISWAIITEKEIDKILSLNLMIIHNYYELSDIEKFKNLSNKELIDLQYKYIQWIFPSKDSINKYSDEFDKIFQLIPGTSICIFMYLVANKIISVDLTKPLKTGNIYTINNIDNNELKGRE